MFISAKMGGKDSLDDIKDIRADGFKEELAQYIETLKGYQPRLQDSKTPSNEETNRVPSEN